MLCRKIFFLLQYIYKYNYFIVILKEYCIYAYQRLFFIEIFTLRLHLINQIEGESFSF